MNQIERALRDGIRVEGGERLGWCAYDDIQGCYHNKHNNAREAIRYARLCRKWALEEQPADWAERFYARLKYTQEKYDDLHNRDVSTCVAG